MQKAVVFMRKLTEFIARVTHLSEQFVRFLFVGALNTVFGYCAFAFFVFLGFNYIFAPLFATIIGVLFNFKTIGVLVFKNGDNRLLARFFGVYAVVYLCNVLCLKALELGGINNLYVSGIILVLPLAFLGYGLNKKFVFERKFK